MGVLGAPGFCPPGGPGKLSPTSLCPCGNGLRGPLRASTASWAWAGEAGGRSKCGPSSRPPPAAAERPAPRSKAGRMALSLAGPPGPGPLSDFSGSSEARKESVCHVTGLGNVLLEARSGQVWRQRQAQPRVLERHPATPADPLTCYPMKQSQEGPTHRDSTSRSHRPQPVQAGLREPQPKAPACWLWDPPTLGPGLGQSLSPALPDPSVCPLTPPALPQGPGAWCQRAESETRAAKLVSAEPWPHSTPACRLGGPHPGGRKERGAQGETEGRGPLGLNQQLLLQLKSKQDELPGRVAPGSPEHRASPRRQSPSVRP